MKTTGLTLAEALASGLPFKHVEWVEYLEPTNMDKRSCPIFVDDFIRPVWEVKPPKPKMRVWKNHHGVLSLSEEKESPFVVDATDQLKEILKDSDNG
jgi:hypothetical protein